MINIDISGKSFGSAPVLGVISYQIHPGDCIAILGPSGIGKTTLLRLITGLDEDFEGAIKRPERIAMVFQEPTLLPWRSVLENLTLTTGISTDEAKNALSRVGLKGKDQLFPDQLSLGQQRRLALARALAIKPELLVMDEPFASLDPDLADEMISLTRELVTGRGITTLLVTHSKAEAKALATQILKLDGSPAVLTKS